MKRKKLIASIINLGIAIGFICPFLFSSESDIGVILGVVYLAASVICLYSINGLKEKDLD